MSSECAKNSSEVDSLNTSTNNFQANEDGNSLKSTCISLIADDSPNKSKLSGGVHSTYPKSTDDSLNVSFVRQHPENAILENTFTELMQKMRANHYNISKDQELLINDRCKLLFEKDYICKVVNNCNYTLNYPLTIVIPIGKKTNPEGPFVDFDETLYSKLVEKAHDVRRRSRFVTPAILFDNKLICRSATLSVKLPILHEIAAGKNPPQFVCSDEDALKILGEVAAGLFQTDVEIVEYLKIEHIVDLMTHYDKICPKTTGFVTSEKTYENLYKKIKVEEMPYTGSDYFNLYYEAGRNAKDLLLNWKQRDCVRRLNVTGEQKYFSKDDANTDHKNWDLSKLTQNYLKIMLSQLVTDVGGMVIHCASGWDRTPLFVALLRLSLWADGVIHESLNFQEILYLTIAYDWFLFGHKFPLRFEANEEILHFCFNFLECITSDEFSITRLFHQLPAEKKRNREFPEFVPGRRVSLNKVRTLFLELYEKEIIQKNKL